jgi:cytochrome c biogenesis protein CcmG, thiol:disulfide interchange protein DsbE
MNRRVVDSVSSESPVRRRRVAPFITLGIAVLLVGLVVVFARAPRGERPETAATVLMNKPAPPIEGETLDGARYSLAARRGSWVAVNFFQSSCQPCITEQPELTVFHDGQDALAPERRTELISVVFDDSAENVRKFFAKRGGGNWPVLLDKTAEINVAYSMARVPETWIIDPLGVVRKRIITNVTAVGLQGEIDRLRVGKAP